MEEKVLELSYTGSLDEKTEMRIQIRGAFNGSPDARVVDMTGALGLDQEEYHRGFMDGFEFLFDYLVKYDGAQVEVQDGE